MSSAAAIPSRLIPVPTGLAGVKATLALMVRLAKQYKVHPFVRELAKTLTARCAERDQLCEVTALQHFVRDQVRYVLDVHEVETLQTPLNTLGYIELPGRYIPNTRLPADWRPNASPPVAAGDCDDKATLLAALMLSIGIPGCFCAIAVNDEPDPTHVLVKARLHGYGYVPLETILPGVEPGWFPPDASCEMLAHFG